MPNQQNRKKIGAFAVLMSVLFLGLLVFISGIFQKRESNVSVNDLLGIPAARADAPPPPPQEGGGVGDPNCLPSSCASSAGGGW